MDFENGSEHVRALSVNGLGVDFENGSEHVRALSVNGLGVNYSRGRTQYASATTSIVDDGDVLR